MNRRFSVVLCGYYGFGNLGDELLASVMIELLAEQGVEKSRIALLSADPSSSEEILGVHAVDRWRLTEVWKTLRESDFLLLGGGGLFQDSTSIRSCLYYWGVVRMALLSGCHPWMFGNSIGPLHHRISELMAKNAIHSCFPRVVRDRSSLKILEKWGISGKVISDPVLAMRPLLVDNRERNVLLVNVRPWNEELERQTAEEATRLAAEWNIPLIGVALSPDDEMLMRDLRAAGILDCEEICRPQNRSQAGDIWSRAVGGIGMRLHFCVLSALHGISCVAVPYDPKVIDFANRWQIPCWQGKGEFPLKKGSWISSERYSDVVRVEIEELFASSWYGLKKNKK